MTDLPYGVSEANLNPDLAALHEIGALLKDRVITYSYGGTDTFKEVQVGFVRRPAWFPAISLVTGDSDFGLRSSGSGAGLRARNAQSDFLLSIQYEDADTEQGFARMSDLKWDLGEFLARISGAGKFYHHLTFSEIESAELVPEDPEVDLSWGFRGLVMAAGTIHFK